MVFSLKKRSSIAHDPALVLLHRTIKYQGSMTVAIKDIYIITRYAGNCHFDDKK